MIDFTIQKEYEQRFGCVIRYDEPGSDLVVDYDDRTYLIPTDWSDEKLQSCLSNGLKTSEDTLFEVVKENEVQYEPNVIY